MEIMVECPNCTNLVYVDCDESAETDWADCPKCGSDLPLRAAIARYHKSKQRESSDFVITAGVLEEYRGRSYEVRLPASVTVIKGGERDENSLSYSFLDGKHKGCFEDNQDITEFCATTNLRVIGAYAFANCKRLRRILLPEGLVKIGYGAFEGCDSLEEVVIPITCGCIFSGAFRNCKNLKHASFICRPSEYRFHSEFKSHSEWLGYGCRDNGLAKVDAWDTYCPDVPERAKCFDLFPDELFKGCVSLREVNIPSCVWKIGRHCFAGCASLESANIGCWSVAGCLSGNEEICSIGEGAFYGCKSLGSIDLSASGSLRWIDDDAFRDCSALKRVELPTRLQRKSFETGRSYEKLKLCVGEGVFGNCDKLEHINIPDFVTFSGGSSFRYPFDGCKKLQVDISKEKMLKDCLYFRGSGPDGKGLSERCFDVSAIKYNRLERVKSELLYTHAELANCGEELQGVSFFDFESKSKIKQRISELERRWTDLWHEGSNLDKEAKREVERLCREYDIDFQERFCQRKGSGMFSTFEWESFSDWWRRVS